MAPTTLITFLVRTPPSTRSVSLHGSWDNFSTPYPMQRDSRTGPEHWSGCHSFSNIICDGDLQPNGVPREGGLKMGGTYWYYYKLDDEIEFHNSAEPSTTSCPLLPGQLVNVLNVPFALSTSRPRNDSVSSTGSEYRTMNPTDKFLNPRPVPAKPSLPRLKTSPTFPQQSWSSSSSPVSASSRQGRSTTSRGPSQPGSANTFRVIRLTKKPSVEGPSRSTSRGSNRSVGIMSAFRALASPRMASPEAGVDRGRAATVDENPPVPLSRAPSGRSITPKRSGLGQMSPVAEIAPTAASGPNRELALRREFDQTADGVAALTMSSFGQHRRQGSLSREPSTLRNSLSLEGDSEQASLDQPNVHYHPLETLKEVLSASNTPVWPVTAMRVEEGDSVDEKQIPLDLEKRLPTLPNTPSSAYPPSNVDESPSNRLSDDIEHLQSRFSSTTIETESHTDSYIPHERSHFSDWTYDTAKLSPQSEYDPSIIDFEPMSPAAEDEFEFRDIHPIDVTSEGDHRIDLETKRYSAAKQDGLPSASSFSTVSSVASSATPSSHVDLDGAKEAEFAWSKFQHYSLPTEDVGSGVTLKRASTTEKVAPLVVDEHHRPGTFQPQLTFDGPAIPHSTSMQQLLDELSYLGGMIQQN
ncbi:uncharacterized protein Z518_01927 [Rhinocladiella mackenziei CBS 650.93]|uniref:AMP-activated protein kinase glycogen-binding domain-containing protein n=1 Tax=Rhinocladiella mackenziei CBS 650.93 TaxID=1442369 RepID=A0A0D2IN70_9EURO|nr:uncharacterized protein Z518_01927 [Rhinocladiella mackenziei CBS 650.93]KIX07274.1 hypothetical protein Z518_01927 [Rhinocladiella mackenziei CBS 650.93]